jgi:hypothetical protein
VWRLQQAVTAASVRAARLLRQGLEVLPVRVQDRPLERRQGRRVAVGGEPLPEADDVLLVLVGRRLLPAFEGEVGEERLIDFGERCFGIGELVHGEAPATSARLVQVLIRRWLKEPRRGRLSVNPVDSVPLPKPRAGVAQLAERQPSKLHVASSNLVSRSNPLDL